MMPTVTQQLDSMRATMDRVIIPALAADDTFAREQAGLISATLSWLLDVHESEYRYEATEATEYRTLLAALLDIDGAERNPRSDKLRAILAEPPAGTGPTEGDLAAVRDQTRRMKHQAMAFLARSGDAGPDVRRTARELVMGVAERQGCREQAWFRMTGFPQDVPGDIATVLRDVQIGVARVPDVQTGGGG